MGQVDTQPSNIVTIILRLLAVSWVLLLPYMFIAALGSQLHTMSRVITIFGHRCFGQLAVCILSEHGVYFFSFYFFEFIIMHCYGGSWWVMIHLSANLAEKMWFFAYRKRNWVERRARRKGYIPMKCQYRHQY